MSSPAKSRRVGDEITIPGDYQYRATWEGKPAQMFWHRGRFDVALKMLRVGKGDTVIDVGCGSGVFADKVASVEGVEKVIGIDANPNAINFAKEKFRRSNLSFESGLVDRLPFGSQWASRISFLEVIEHVHEHQAREVLTCFHNLMNPGGRLVISTPNQNSLWPCIEWSLDRLGLTPRLADEQHVKCYSSRSLADLVCSQGFELVESTSIHAMAPWLAPLRWSLAESVAKWESRRRLSWGALLIQAFEKKH